METFVSLPLYTEILRLCFENKRPYFHSDELGEKRHTVSIKHSLKWLVRNKFLKHNRSTKTWRVMFYYQHLEELGKILSRYLDNAKKEISELKTNIQLILKKIDLSPIIIEALIKSSNNDSDFENKIKKALGLDDSEFKDLQKYFYINFGLLAFEHKLTFSVN